MRTVIVGLDFVYDSSGNLKPIEMNTNTGYAKNKIENDNDVFDMGDFENFVVTNEFVKITYIGGNTQIKNQIENVCTQLSLEFDSVETSLNSITIPFVEDSSTHLVVRTSYDSTAILDELYCKSKVGYLNLIKDEEFGSEFAYLNDEGVLINTITTILDNGIHPNFILKAVAPAYNKSIYPKFFKVTNQTELDVVLGNVNQSYFLMPYYFNESKVHLDRVTKIRKISMFFPPNLESIHIGSYTDLSSLKLHNGVTYDLTTFEIDKLHRESYFTRDVNITRPKLMDDDYVIMADGTPKSGLDLQVGDVIRTIDIPNPENSDTTNVTVNYQIDMETFLDGVVFSTNRVTNKQRIDVSVETAQITFTDGTDWFDTINSSYLIYEDNEIQFKKIGDLIEGNVVLLIDISDETNVQIIQKTVQTVNVVGVEFSGWIIEVERTHLFLTSNGNPTTSTTPYYVTIEHNCFFDSDCGKGGQCINGDCAIQ
jgi:hypothetical protein